jgi:hypothetical protein
MEGGNFVMPEEQIMDCGQTTDTSTVPEEVIMPNKGSFAKATDGTARSTVTPVTSLAYGEWGQSRTLEQLLRRSWIASLSKIQSPTPPYHTLALLVSFNKCIVASLLYTTLAQKVASEREERAYGTGLSESTPGSIRSNLIMATSENSSKVFVVARSRLLTLALLLKSLVLPWHRLLNV